MFSKNRRDVTPDDFDGLDGVPTYTSGDSSGSSKVTGAGPTPDIYQRTGKAAPTEVFPASAGTRADQEQRTEYIDTRAQSARTPDDRNETVALDRTVTSASAAPEPSRNDAVVREAAPAPVREAAPVPETTHETVYATTTYEPVSAEPESYPAEPVAVAEPRARRGTIDFGLLLLRLVTGGYLILDAVKTFFRLGNSDGITGLEDAFSGYTYGDVLAVVLPTLELAAGVFLVLGLLSPVAAMVAVAATGFNAAHAVAASGTGANALQWDASVWLPVLLFGASLALQFTGPGFYAVDAGRSWARRPLASSWIFAVLGIAAAALMWWFGTGVNPFA
ncbi:DoxX family protein [Corynebacterium sp. UBA2622]|uniref:DoxX family protein n=1 Tax=Corynebacterium sp. UBA2622 TaxID=1946393 RepID=UPI0025B80C3A|nr:DoxX family membrane protein [Corynebacterium sp. UBA2622]